MSGTNENVLRLDGLLSMGYGIIPKKAMRDARLTPEAKAIYAYLCSFAGSGNTAFPSVDLMCAEIGMSEDRFYRHRKLLVQYGYIAFKQIRGGRGKTGSNVYTILHEQVEAVEEPKKKAAPDNRDPQNTDPQNKGPQIRDPQNKGTQNKGTINNSLTNNSLTKNNVTNNSERDKGERKRSTRKAFVPPTLEEVREYIDQMGYGLDPEEFMDSNLQSGWTLKNGQPVKDWKARVRTFERFRKSHGARSMAFSPASKQSVVIREDSGQKWGLFDE